MKQYYKERAAEYDEIYQIPMRQSDIRLMQMDLSCRFNQYKVLEIACGTGYWTQFIAQSAARIDATDTNQAVLDIAGSRSYLKQCKVTFYQDNAFDLNTIKEIYTAAFAGFWVSHVKKSEMKLFLKNLHSKLSSDALVVFIDNRFVHEHSTTVHRYDEEGNGYQVRSLKSGKQFEVVKNFPDLSYFKLLLVDIAYDLRFEELTFFWSLSYRLK